MSASSVAASRKKTRLAESNSSGYFYSARHIYLAVKYLKNLTYYEDEDGWVYPDNKAVRKYTYKWVLDFVHSHSGSPEDLWRDLFMTEAPRII